MINTEKLVGFLASRKMTANQYLLCHLLYMGEHDLLATLVKNDKLKFTKKEVDDLIKNGYVEKLFGDTSQFSFIATDKFSRALFVDSEEAGQQLWDTYPKVLDIEGVMQSTRTCDKDDVLEVYYKRIKGSKKKHEYVMQMLNHYVDLVKSRKMNAMGIEKWIKGENWDVVAELVDVQVDEYKSDLI